MPSVFDPNQQNQDPNNQQNQGGGVNLSGSGGESSPSGAGGRTAQFSSGAAPTQKGSGRYTNLQKYIGANQGATDRLHQGISGKIGKEIEQKQQESNTQASKVKEGIQSASQSLQQGQGYLGQLGQKDFNAEQFVQDQPQLDQFSKFRTGQAIDQQQLGQQLGQAEQSALAAQQQVQQRLGQVGTDAGRFGLLKETFGGRSAYKPTYSSGQQRLDQLFLQSGAGNKVGQLQDQLRQSAHKSGQSLQEIQSGLDGQIKDIGSQASQLASGLQAKTGELETGYITGLEGQVGGINTQRDAERAKYEQFINQLGGKATGGELDSNLLKEFNLMQNQQLFNVPKNLNTFRDVVNVDDRQAQTYRDIATSKDVSKYGALAKLAGIDPSKLNQVGELVDPVTGQITRAASAKTGESSLQGQIDAAKNRFLDYAKAKDIQAYVQNEGKEYQTGINLSDFIGKAADDARTDISGFVNAASAGKDAYGPKSDRYAQSVRSDAGYYDPGVYNFGGKQFGNKDVRDFMREAAINQTRQNALAELANQGFFNVLGSTGGTQGSQTLSDYREGGQYTPKKLI